MVFEIIVVYIQYFTAYEKLKQEKEEATAKSKMEQLERLQKDLGYGESVAMDTTMVTVDQYSVSKNPEISLGAGDEAAGKIENDEMEDPQELQSFQRFLTRECEKSPNLKR